MLLIVVIKDSLNAELRTKHASNAFIRMMPMQRRNPSRRLFRSLPVVFGVCLIFTALAAQAEIVHLNNGSTQEGFVKRNGDGYDVTDSTGKLIHIAAEDVQRIEIGSKINGVVETESRLQSLRRSVENIADLKAIIERYVRFIEQNKDSPIAKEADLDLAAWRERQEKGMIKVGPRWVTPEQRDELKEKGLVVAGAARELLRQGRMKDAEPILQQALDEDPANAAAAYLHGLLQYRQEKLPDARKSFEASDAAFAEHGPTLNNLAIVHWRQNQVLPALTCYVRAMIAAPNNRDILNNVAEALHALSAAQRATPAAKKATRLFAAQDLQLQQQLSEKGLYRWGSTWVDKARFDKLQAIEKEIQKQLDQLSADFDAIKKKIAGIEADIDTNARRMKSLVDTSYTRDSNGNLIQLPLPRRYYDLERENEQLSADRDALGVKLKNLRTTAKLAQQQMPLPQFTAVQLPIGIEGTPMLPPIPTKPLVSNVRDRPDLLPPKDITIVAAPGLTSTRPAKPASQPSTHPAPPNKIPDSLLNPE